MKQQQLSQKRRDRATMGGWFLEENKHITLRFTVFYAPEGPETLVKRQFFIS